MKKADFIIIAAVAVVVAVLLFFLYGVNKDAGNVVKIEVDGNVVETLSLTEDTTRQIETDNGGVNVLVIKDGTAVMTQANCPDGICTNHNPIKRSGESIICLPHKVVITVENEKNNNNEVDAVA
ncbi:MAG: NusG domain II-containing protein [Clostridium sp.]|nr:NusG domain II-containing protein [Clostridium sp.]